jgi:poly(hydroxyalkanoate) depolymerase family esterase
MPRRRASRALPKSLLSLLPLTKPPSLPAALRRRSAQKTPRRTPRPAPTGVWVGGTQVGLGGGRAYEVYLPAGLRRRTRVPVVVLLHGCGQTPAEFVKATRFAAAADRNGFLLVVPHQQAHHHPRRCWHWYESAHQRRGAGEPAAIAGIIRQVTAEQTRWRVDPSRIYVAGLSAGGAMALTVGAAYPDLVAAVGVHSAPAYRSSARAPQALAAMAARTEVPPPLPGAAAIPPTIVIQGRADTVVRAGSGDRIADQWLAHRAAAGDTVGQRRASGGRTTDGRRYDVLRWYGPRGRRVLEYWLVDNLGHAWSGGLEKGSFSDPNGPRATTLMCSFFRLHALDARAARQELAAGA